MYYKSSLRFIFFACLFVPTLVLCGCGGSTSGYVEVDGKWGYVRRGGIGDHYLPQTFGADDATFKVLAGGLYGKDQNQVFYRSRPVVDADPLSFKVCSDSRYAQDNDSVYLEGIRIHGANPKTFTLQTWPYSKDDQYAYCGTLAMQVKSLDDFVVTLGGGITTTTSGSDVLGRLDNYKNPMELDLSSTTVIYGIGCTAKSGSQSFQGPILVED